MIVFVGGVDAPAGGRMPARHAPPQHPLPLDEREAPQVATVESEAIERDEAGGGTAVEERIEQRSPVVIETDDLAVEDRVHGSHRRCSG